MTAGTKSLFWVRTDCVGTDHAVVGTRDGVTVRGTAQAADPLPYTCRYELHARADWAPVRLEVSTEGAGWQRTVRLERNGANWRVRSAEQGDLDAVLARAGLPAAGLPGAEDPDRLSGALDVDVSASPLFNTVPVRRLNLLTADPGSTRTIGVVWVLVPGLMVIPTEQVYTALGPGRVRFDGEGGYTAELSVDPEGFVLRYPGLAERADLVPG